MKSDQGDGMTIPGMLNDGDIPLVWYQETAYLRRNVNIYRIHNVPIEVMQEWHTPVGEHPDYCWIRFKKGKWLPCGTAEAAWRVAREEIVMLVEPFPAHFFHGSSTWLFAATGCVGALALSPMTDGK